jgi:hypothetical protein
MTRLHAWKRSLAGGFLLLAALATPACGDSKGKLYGVVTYAGKPVEGGTVLIVGADKQKPVRCEIDSEGRYTAAGVPLGAAKLAVLVPPSLPSPPLPKNVDPKSLPPRAAPSANIPRKYMDPETSGFTCTVTSGSQKFDLDLK